MAVAKAKSTLQRRRQELSGYKFDTSNYIIFNSGVRRDVDTGKLVIHLSDKKASKKQK